MGLEEEKRREALGTQIVCDLLEISRLTQQPIKEIRLNTNGVFEEVKNPVCDHDLDQ
ncbi:hypothetical protein [Acinetobacter sp. ANC 3903]|uniref:hypothetical protein n=1 Tax=Acinetobacter sp. ANC 3903 TaxID=1977883 RepID=UPI00148A6810|nr:hypothetical protein [Acinetobacter sp. ANC 3903]